MTYVAWARDVLPPPANVLELGSYNVNGSVRTMFLTGRWHGVDIRTGPGVDEVADARDYDGSEQYDLVVTTEMLEHCEDAGKVFESVYKSLKPGGFLIATMAGEGRHPHRNDGEHFDPRMKGDEFYRNVTEETLREWCEDAGLEVLNLSYEPVSCDLRCIAWKSKRP